MTKDLCVRCVSYTRNCATRAHHAGQPVATGGTGDTLSFRQRNNSRCNPHEVSTEHTAGFLVILH